MENDMHASDSVTPPTATEARAALAGLSNDGVRLAARMVTPPWYHPVLGLIIAAFVVSQAMPGPLSTVVLVIGLAWLVVLLIAYRRRYGISTSQPAGRRSRTVLIVAMAILIGLMLVSVVIKFAALALWWVLAPAAIAFVVTVVLGRRYDAVLRNELAQNGSRQA